MLPKKKLQSCGECGSLPCFTYYLCSDVTQVAEGTQQTCVMDPGTQYQHSIHAKFCSGA